jgi:hypothetical protein
MDALAAYSRIARTGYRRTSLNIAEKRKGNDMPEKRPPHTDHRTRRDEFSKSAASFWKSTLVVLGLAVALSFSTVGVARAESTPADNDALTDRISFLIGAYDTGTVLGLVPEPVTSLAGEFAAIESNLALKVVAPAFNPPPDQTYEPDDGECYLSGSLPQTKDTFEDWFGFWTIDSLATNWGPLGTPQVLHANSSVVVEVNGTNSIHVGDLELREGVHNVNWTATTQFAPVFDAIVPLVLFASGIYSEVGAAPGLAAKAAGKSATRARVIQKGIKKVMINIGQEAGLLALDYTLDDAINDELPTVTNNGGTQSITILDVHTPIIGPSGVPEPVLEAMDFGGTRFIRIESELRDRLNYFDPCGRPVKLTHDSPNIIPIGVSQIMWTAADKGPYAAGVPTFATYAQTITVEDTQPPLLVAPSGFVKELGVGETELVLDPDDLTAFGQPQVIDLADPAPTVDNDAPASIPVDTRVAVQWTATDGSGNAISKVQLVTARSPGANQAPTVEPILSAMTETALPVDIRLDGLDPDLLPTLLGGSMIALPDQLTFEIVVAPEHGEFVAPLKPFFIEDFRLSPVGETEESGTFTSPLGALAAEFAALPPSQHMAWIQTNFCDLALTPPINMVYRPSYVHVTDDNDYYVRDAYFDCNASTLVQPRISRWNRARDFMGHYRLADADGGLGIPKDFFTIDRDGLIWWIGDEPSFGGSQVSLHHMELDFSNVRSQTFVLSEQQAIGFSRGFQHAHGDAARNLTYVHDSRGVIVYRLDDWSELGRLSVEGETLFLPGNDDNPFTPLPADFNCPVPYGEIRTWMTTDSKGALYVTDTCRDRVLKFDPSTMAEDGSFVPGEFVGWMGRCSANVAPFSGCDEATGVSRGFACSDSTCLRDEGTAGDAKGQFDKVSHINVDPFDQLYVADPGNLRVQRFGSDGVLTGEAKSAGTGVNMGEAPGFVLGNMGRPSAVSVNSTKFFVLESDPTLGDFFLHVFETIPFEPIEVDPGHANDLDGDLYEDNAVMVRYVPRFDFPGVLGLDEAVDTFTWRVFDGLAPSNDGIVEIMVERTDRAPEKHAIRCYDPADPASQIPCALDEDTSIDVELIAKDPDGILGIDGLDTLVYVLTEPPQNGSWVLQSSSAFSVIYRFTPDPDWNGTEAIEYNVSDGVFDTPSGPLELLVKPVDDDPVFALVEANTPRGFPSLLQITMTDIDADADERVPDLITFVWGNGETESPGGFALNAQGLYEMMPGPILTQTTPGVHQTIGMPTYEGAPGQNPTINWQYAADGYHDGAAHIAQLGPITVFEATYVSVDLTIAGAMPDPEPVPGEVLFSIDVTNQLPQGWAGLTADDVSVVLDLPSGLQFTTFSPLCTQNGSDPQLTCSLGALSPGSTVSVPFGAEPDGVSLPRPVHILRVSVATTSPDVAMSRFDNEYLSFQWPDGDGDGLPDAWEGAFGLDQGSDDSGVDGDNDGLVHLDEYDEGTDPTLADSDGDGLEDGFEVANDFDPLGGFESTDDPDLDGLTNLQEQSQGTDPGDADSDGDGLGDGVEFFFYASDPLDFDSDDDGLSDGDEVNLHLTSPNDVDSDDDGLLDGFEVDNGFDPVNSDESAEDPDLDGLTNLLEQLADTNPNQADSDGDGVIDSDQDDDGDGLTLLEEISVYFTDPDLTDTDGDGISDGVEVNGLNTDPTQVEAATIFAHLGAANPVLDEGWNIGGSGSGILVGPIFDDNGLGVDAWIVDDNSTAGNTTRSYGRTPGATLGHGWILRTRIRVVDHGPDPVSENASVHVEYSNGATGFGMDFRATAAGDPVVYLEGGGGSVTLTGLGDGYHDYELVFDPHASPASATLWVDGLARITGYTGFGRTLTRVIWGGLQSSTTGEGRYNRVEWSLLDGTADRDRDGLADAVEVGLGTEVLVADTDGDGFADGEEVSAGTDPLDEFSFPTVTAVPAMDSIGHWVLGLAMLWIGLRAYRDQTRAAE